MVARSFGRLPGGDEIQEIRLSADGIEVDVLTWGAVIRDFRLVGPRGPRSVVLGFDRLEDYLEHSPYFGAVVGRCANRIGGGAFELDGRTVEVDRNEAGRQHLHGGSDGFWNRAWDVRDLAGDQVTLALVSGDGDQGYPGQVAVLCRYALAGGRLLIDLVATTDAPTVVNLATHSYFDLDRSDTILDHRLTVPAAAVTAVDDALIPTGVLEPVAGTGLDFRSGAPVGAAGGSLDLNYVLAEAPTEDTHLAARLEGPRSGIALEIHTTEPGLQVYDGNAMKPGAILSDGRPMRRNGGICLEPQRYPDAVHHPHFPSVILRPGETYRQRTEYRLWG
jgi:aldose 1-epimerase